jgi:predicted methyltransferase
MKFLKLTTLILSGFLSVSTMADALQTAIDGDNRSANNKARDAFRHPYETLTFFDVKPDHKVVEIWPGGGWYTEILAPYLSADGQFIAAHFPADTKSDYFKKSLAKYQEKMASDPASYSKVVITSLLPPNHDKITESDSADRVLTFRNVHNWMGSGIEGLMFETFFDALKPGGKLGVIEHRAPVGSSKQFMKDSGYVTEAYVIELAENAGFELLASGDMNNNPNDTKDYKDGVWTLPPTLRLKDKDREKYLAIGESDRMTLLFVKPE